MKKAIVSGIAGNNDGRKIPFEIEFPLDDPWFVKELASTYLHKSL